MQEIAPLREYWYGGLDSPGQHTLWRAEHSWTTARLCAHRYMTRAGLIAALRSAGSTSTPRIVHVRVYRTGQLAAWERVVRAADRLECSWGVKLTRGEAQRALTGMFAAVRALGPHRPGGA